MINNVTTILLNTLMYSAPLVFGGLGGVISEKSGVVNIGIEGMMTIGAFVGTTVGYFTNNPWLGFLAGGFFAAIFSLLHALASVTFKADQTISGIALNLIGPGLSIFLCRVLFSGQTVTYPVNRKLPKILSTIDISVALAIFCVVILWVILYKTKWGLRILAVGEHPAAADTLGINVSTVRYACVLASGFLAGLGGASTTLAIVSYFSPTAIAGQGFIALAAVIFGKWNPLGTYLACLLFAFFQAIAINFGASNLLPSEIINMIPYILTIVVLVLFVGKSAAPKASGVPYEKNSR